MTHSLTNIQTKAQFTQYGKVVTVTYNGNKLMAMNAIRLAYGVKSFSILQEYKTYCYLPTGYYSTN